MQLPTPEMGWGFILYIYNNTTMNYIEYMEGGKPIVVKTDTATTVMPTEYPLEFISIRPNVKTIFTKTNKNSTINSSGIASTTNDNYIQDLRSKIGKYSNAFNTSVFNSGMLSHSVK